MLLEEELSCLEWYWKFEEFGWIPLYIAGRRTLSRVKHFVYILKCGDEKLYTGYTTDPERRLKEHNSGRGGRFTRGRKPLRLVYLELLSSKSEALSREVEIKSLDREKKLKLISTPGEASALGP